MYVCVPLRTPYLMVCLEPHKGHLLLFILTLLWRFWIFYNVSIYKESKGVLPRKMTHRGVLMFNLEFQNFESPQTSMFTMVSEIFYHAKWPIGPKSWIRGNSKKKAKRVFAIDLDNEYKNLLRLKFDKASSYTLIKEV